MKSWGRASDVLAPDFLEGKGYWNLTIELPQHQLYRLGILEDFIPPAELLPPKITLKRMAALSSTVELAPELRKQRPVLEAFANTLSRAPGGATAPEVEAKQLLTLAKSDESLDRLYWAAIDFGFADELSAHIEYLEGLRNQGALTDVEQEEYQEASAHMRTCLMEAARQLALPSKSSFDGPGDELLRVWKNTQHVAAQTSDAEAARR